MNKLIIAACLVLLPVSAHAQVKQYDIWEFVSSSKTDRMTGEATEDGALVLLSSNALRKADRPMLEGVTIDCERSFTLFIKNTSLPFGFLKIHKGRIKLDDNLREIAVMVQRKGGSAEHAVIKSSLPFYFEDVGKGKELLVDVSDLIGGVFEIPLYGFEREATKLIEYCDS